MYDYQKDLDNATKKEDKPDIYVVPENKRKYYDALSNIYDCNQDIISYASSPNNNTIRLNDEYMDILNDNSDIDVESKSDKKL